MAVIYLLMLSKMLAGAVAERHLRRLWHAESEGCNAPKKSESNWKRIGVHDRRFNSRREKNVAGA